MKLLFDLHTHTLMSGHAYSTLAENIASAKEAGLLAYGFSEHAPGMKGSVQDYYFANLKILPETINGIRIFGGIEANIVDYDGTLDCSPDLLSKVHYAVASLHPPCIAPASQDLVTSAVLGAMNNPLINIIGHPDDSRFPLDYQAVAEMAAKTGTLLEVNNTSLSAKCMRQNAQENVREMLKQCMRYDARIIVNTDSHICFDVGRFDEAIAVLEDVGFPEELIVNTSMDKLHYALNRTTL